MAKSTRLLKSFYRLFLPVIVLLLLAGGAASIYFVNEASHPTRAGYIVTPDKYGQLNMRAAQITDEKWTNKDGTPARGWLLRGGENQPAVVLLHRYGADRSYILNLGVKLNEATNFTVLMPDMRGHGLDPAVNYTSFGGCESGDVAAAVEFLRRQQTPQMTNLVSNDIGIYGLEMGALAGLASAAKDPSIKAAVFDSVPYDSDGLVASVIDRRYPFMSTITGKLGQIGAYPYFYEGCYTRVPACEDARLMSDRSVLLLAGVDAPEFQETTTRVGRCFPSSTRTETKTDLSPSGNTILNASMEVSAAYDQRVIDFFRRSLGPQDGQIIIASNNQ